jgi:hypothetical protein
MIMNPLGTFERSLSAMSFDNSSVDKSAKHRIVRRWVVGLDVAGLPEFGRWRMFLSGKCSFGTFFAYG